MIEQALTIRRVHPPQGVAEDHLIGARLAGRSLSIYLTVPEKVPLRGVLEVSISEPGKPPKHFDQTLQPPAPELRPGFIHSQRVTLLLGRGETRITVRLRRPNEAVSVDAGADAGAGASDVTPVLSGAVKR